MRDARSRGASWSNVAAGRFRFRPAEWPFSDRMVNARVELDFCHECCHRIQTSQ
jgi:hypothetical protein